MKIRGGVRHEIEGGEMEEKTREVRIRRIRKKLVVCVKTVLGK